MGLTINTLTTLLLQLLLLPALTVSSPTPQLTTPCAVPAILIISRATPFTAKLSAPSLPALHNQPIRLALPSSFVSNPPVSAYPLIVHPLPLSAATVVTSIPLNLTLLNEHLFQNGFTGPAQTVAVSTGLSSVFFSKPTQSPTGTVGRFGLGYACSPETGKIRLEVLAEGGWCARQKSVSRDWEVLVKKTTWGTVQPVKCADVNVYIEDLQK